jgi:hypothetical protein
MVATIASAAVMIAPASRVVVGCSVINASIRWLGTEIPRSRRTCIHSRTNAIRRRSAVSSRKRSVKT